ncbi:hypothetical protein BDZ94DRAFT_1245259 [Collybia nuda]|uniref:Uncharacterized protein n=1 Tax=Collybia nuda TaxID=64659 RepID=A0A9P5YGW6_9AGAR|nr:hypothetical protein BDZ94DRAFT_1245259 [Collybia nuda]
MIFVTRSLAPRRLLSSPRAQWRPYSKGGPNMPKSAHAQWYADVVPAMIPIFLLGSAVYLGLQLTQVKLSHEKHMEEAMARVKVLEAEVELLHEKRMKMSQGQESLPQTSSDSLNDKQSRRWWW